MLKSMYLYNGLEKEIFGQELKTSYVGSARIGYKFYNTEVPNADLLSVQLLLVLSCIRNCIALIIEILVRVHCVPICILYR